MQPKKKHGHMCVQWFETKACRKIRMKKKERKYMVGIEAERWQFFIYVLSHFFGILMIRNDLKCVQAC